MSADNADYTDPELPKPTWKSTIQFMPVVLPLQKMSRDEKLRAMGGALG